MFHSARLKLTGWYLLIIMLISMIFSLAIYGITTDELERGYRRVGVRFRAEELGIPFPQQFPKHWEDLNPNLKNIDTTLSFIEDLEATKKRMALGLLSVNGVILIISTAAGYFLAGKTLNPIEKAMEEQKRFVADASHEFRTPLTALRASMEVFLREKKISVNQSRKLIKSNLEDVKDMHSLTDNLLSLASLQDNGNSLNFEEIDLKKTIKATFKKILPLAKKKGVSVKLNLNDIVLKADRMSLEEMILIFLDNAVKYTPKRGKVIVSVSKEKRCAFIKIKDTGIGISKKDIPHLFDRFYRVDQSRSKNNTQGFGLGLSLAQRIIKDHKGSVEVISTLKKGTTFTIKLPLNS